MAKRATAHIESEATEGLRILTARFGPESGEAQSVDATVRVQAVQKNGALSLLVERGALGVQPTAFGGQRCRLFVRYTRDDEVELMASAAEGKELRLP